MRFWTVHALPAPVLAAPVLAAPVLAAPVLAASELGTVPAPTARWLLSRRRRRPSVVPHGGLALVPESVPLLALLLPLLWLLWHRCWLAALLFLIATVAVLLLPLGPLAGWVTAGLHLLTGLSAQDIRRWSLARHGRPAIAVVEGADEESAMFRLLTQRPDLARAVA
ncbi:uncharacterized protein DUF2628 [Humitalea rosea]|uniref:Uncharacterized protein DUF2628 n=1 Tax=Humitalea rosea TaxID=990373 RepID=A0A2W7IIZ9_9PROT|nr:DUF2628 domain-containing protein [Humitalea rosea]PZW46613.1 uncharacterized protein DUF2628 [Humitalea rosea]